MNAETFLKQCFLSRPHHSHTHVELQTDEGGNRNPKLLVLHRYRGLHWDHVQSESWVITYNEHLVTYWKFHPTSQTNALNRCLSSASPNIKHHKLHKGNICFPGMFFWIPLDGTGVPDIVSTRLHARGWQDIINCRNVDVWLVVWFREAAWLTVWAQCNKTCHHCLLFCLSLNRCNQSHRYYMYVRLRWKTTP